MASNSFPHFSLLGNAYETGGNRNTQMTNDTFSKPMQASLPIGIDGLSPHTDAVVSSQKNSFTSCSPIGDVIFSPNSAQVRSAPAHIVGLFGPLEGSADFIKSLTLSPSFSPDHKGELDYSLSDSDDDEDFSLPPSLVGYPAIFPSDFDTPNDRPMGQLNPINSPSSFLFQNQSPSSSPLVNAGFGGSPSVGPHQIMSNHNSYPQNNAQKVPSTGSPSMNDDDDDGHYSDYSMDSNYQNEEGLTSPNTTGQYGEHPFGEHPSRTLFVRNINSNVEDEELRQLFEVYGPIRSMYTQCKHRGFVMISYFDIRHAKSAMRHLQSKVIRRRKLDIHYSIPKDNPSEKDQNQGTLVVFNLDPSITCDELRKIFGSFGEIKEIRETPNKKHHKFIEFYDVRDADKAMKSLNKTEIKSKKIKIEPSRPGGARKNLINQLQSPELTGSDADFEPPSPSLSASSNPSPSFSPLTNPVNASPSFLYSAPSPSLSAINGNNHNNPPNSPSIDLSSFTNTGSPYSIPRSPTLNAALSPKQKPLLTSPSLNPNSNTGYSMNGNGPTAGTMAAFLLANPSGSNSYMMNNNINSNNNNGNNDYNFDSNYSLFNSSPMGQSQNKPIKPRRNSVKSFTNNRTSPWSPNSLYPMSSPNPGLSSSGPPVSQMQSNMGGTSPQMMGGPPTSSTGHKASRSYSLPVKMNMQAEQMEKQNFELNEKSKRANNNNNNNHHHKDDDGIGNNNNNNNNNNNKNSVSYALDIDSVLNGFEKRTTLMIKNIPNKYTQKMLLATVDELHKGLYDFFYLPIDFKNKCNVGYAFINFIDPKSIVSLYRQLHNNKWEKFNSEKVCEITYARIQGKESLISHFQNSSLMSEDKKCRPIIFHSDGPNQGQQAPFPIGPNVRVRSKEESGMKSPLSNNNNNTRRGVPLTPQKLLSNTVENGKASERTTSVRTRSYSYK